MEGLAAPFAAACATEGALLAAAGVTGPLELFEGAKGFMETLSGPFDIDWSQEGLDRVQRTILKRYNAEIHSQSVIDAILALRRAESIDPNEIEHLDIEIFDVAYNIIGGGNEGEKTRVQSKEQADHSLPYIAAAALLDGRVTPAQYLPERVQRADVQQLLARVSVRPKEEFSRRFPEEMPCRITLRLRSGRAITGQAADYPGFHSRPFDWPMAVDKFSTLAGAQTTEHVRERIVGAVQKLHTLRARDLAALLGEVSWPEAKRELHRV